MEATDLVLIEKHRKTDYNLDRLFREHERLGVEIDKLDSGKVLSADERVKLNALKKNKLRGRDEIEAILAPLR